MTVSQINERLHSQTLGSNPILLEERQGLFQSMGKMKGSGHAFGRFLTTRAFQARVLQRRCHERFSRIDSSRVSHGGIQNGTIQMVKGKVGATLSHDFDNDSMDQVWQFIQALRVTRGHGTVSSVQIDIEMDTIGSHACSCNL